MSDQSSVCAPADLDDDEIVGAELPDDDQGDEEVSA